MCTSMGNRKDCADVVAHVGISRASRHRTKSIITASVIAALLGGTAAVDAASSQWITTVGSESWSSNPNWTSGVPGASSGTANGDIGTFGSNINPGVIAIAGPASGWNVGGINFTGSSAGAYSITGSNALVLSSGGQIGIDSGFGPTNVSETVGTPLSLEGNYTFANDAPLNSSKDLLNINGNVSADNALGSITLTLEGTFPGATDSRTTNQIGGAISDASGTILSVAKNGSGTWYLSKATNSYNGTTTINNGILLTNYTRGVLNQGTSSGVNSPIGSSSNAAANLILNGGALYNYADVGSGWTTDRLFTLGPGGGGISMLSALTGGTFSFSNTGTIAFTGDGNRTLTFTAKSTTGNTTNKFAPQLEDPTAYGATSGNAASGNLSLTINETTGSTGTITWQLTNTSPNTYSGNTTINNAADLQQSAANQLSPNSAMVVNTGGTLDLNSPSDLLPNNATIASLSGNGLVFSTFGGTTGHVTTLTIDTAGVASFGGQFKQNQGSGKGIAVVMNGAGTQVISATQSNTNSMQSLTINSGAVRATAGSGGAAGPGLPPLPLVFNGGVLEEDASSAGTLTFSRALGSGFSAGGVVAWGNGGGGFGVYSSSGGGQLNINIGGSGATMAWEATNFIPPGAPLIFGGPNSTGQVNFQNPLDLGSPANPVTREIRVNTGAGTASAQISGAVIGGSNAALNKTGSGTLTLSNVTSFSGNTTVTTGTLAFTSSASNNNIADVGSITVHSSGSVDVLSSGTGNSTSRTLLVTGGLNFDGSSGAWLGKLDLAANDMVVHNGNLDDITNQLAQGLISQTAGIFSSAVAGNTTLGVATGIASFDSGTVQNTDVLVKYTYYGDANLDGHVDGGDYSLIDSAVGGTKTGWQNGDFNYDGHIDGSDYSLIDNSFNQQSLAGYAGQIAGEMTTPATMPTTPVPEPTLAAISVMAIFGIVVLRRRQAHQDARGS
jgi:fibronectin-binding autotransporter adhesin